jgi:hypothetical protein
MLGILYIEPNPDDFIPDLNLEKIVRISNTAYRHVTSTVSDPNDFIYTNDIYLF